MKRSDEERIESRHSIKSSELMKSGSRDLEADCDLCTFSNEVKVAIVVLD